MTERERITHAAIRVNGEVWALPAPARHHVLVHAWCSAHFKDGLNGRLREHESGFLTNAGRYVDRGEAKRIAEVAGQLLNVPGRSHGLPDLYSEDVW